MATTSQGARQGATTRTSRRNTRRRRSTTAARRTTRVSTATTQPKTPVEVVQQAAERAVLVPVGASLLARDNLISTVRDLVTRYRTRSGVERELRRYERRGVTARNRFERQARRSRTRFERQLRQRRNLVDRTVRQNQRRFRREVRSVRRDIGRQSGFVSARVEKLVSDAQGLINQSS